MTIELIAAVRRRPGMSRKEFFEYISSVHAEISVKEPLELAKYTQNHIQDSISGGAGDEKYDIAPDRDSITVLEFATPGDLFATMRAPYTREVIGPDAVNFSDLTTSAALVADQHVIKPATDRADHATVVAFLNPREGVSSVEFTEVLNSALGGEQLGRFASISVSHRTALGDELISYFGGTGGAHYLASSTVTLPHDPNALSSAWAAIGEIEVVDPRRSFASLVDVRRIFARS